MRTTVRIDDDLLKRLKSRAESSGESLTEAVNATLRRGLDASHEERERKIKQFRQKTFSLGKPLVDLTKALSLAAALEDEAIIAKLEQGK